MSVRACVCPRTLRLPSHTRPWTSIPTPTQVEAHPYWRNDALVGWASSRGIHVTAYSPLGSPDSAAIMRRPADTPGPMKDATVLAIAERLGRSPAQVGARYVQLRS